ncbi:MAG: hypothetical protein IKK82_07575 [Kiritimatiellae bacterium]|nr:hypothetical protein [Kiritimatiellia bacterium]
MRGWICLVAAFAAMGGFAYQVSVGTYVANAGRTVTVPVALDSAAGLSYAGASLTYDPQVLVVTKVEAGTLKTIMPEDFVTTSTNGSVSVSIFGSGTTNIVNGTGTIAYVTFATRMGAEGRYSDIIVSNVDIGECTGVKDVTAGNPVKTVNGMVRVMRTDAAVARLEGAQTLAPDTVLESIKLETGDAIQASDAQTPVVVSGGVTGLTAVPVMTPVNGWASGRYALLKTPTAGLTFTLEGAGDVVFSQETVNGMTTYYATLSVDGEIPVLCEDETLSAGAQNQIRRLLGDKLSGIAQVKVSGPKGLVGIIADMGIAPVCTILGTTLEAVYSLPEIRITGFEPETGIVRIKVTPGEGNTIVSEIATGYLHVYGTDDLAKKMVLIEKVGYDLTPYLKEETKGEAVLNVTLGTHSFFKVKVER